MTETDSELPTAVPGEAPPRRPIPWMHPLLLGAVFVGALVCGLLVSFAIDRWTHRNVVLRGVLAGEVVLSGRTAPEVSAALERVRDRLRARRVEFVVAESRFSATAGEVGFDVAVGAMGRDALSLGRRGSVVGQFGWWLGRLVRPVTLPLRPVLDDAVLQAQAARWEEQALPDRADSGSIRYDGELRVTYPVAGRVLDRSGLGALLRARLGEPAVEGIELPVVREQPLLTRDAVDRAALRVRQLLAGPVQFVTEDGEHSVVFSVQDVGRAIRTHPEATPKPHLALALDRKVLEQRLASVRKSLETAPESARFEVDARHQVTIVPSKPGVVIDEDRITTLLLGMTDTSKRSAVLPMKPAPPPELTTEQARALNITRLVSSFVTYHHCCEARVQNIHRIADLVDGVVVRPGETFSLNGHVGPRTASNGFVLAPGIEEGDMVKTYGGGVSQFTTTLFNAVLDGGYEIIQRQPHSYYFSRYPVGHEATLSYPTPDLAFKNNTTSGMLLKTQYGSKFIKVLVYGGHTGWKVTRKVGKRFDRTEPDNEYVPNPALDPASAVLKAQGTPGWSVVVARIVEYPDGGTQTERRKVTYNPRPRVVEVHPCNIPEGAEGYTGEICPEPIFADGGVDASP